MARFDKAVVWLFWHAPGWMVSLVPPRWWLACMRRHVLRGPHADWYRGTGGLDGAQPDDDLATNKEAQEGEECCR